MPFVSKIKKRYRNVRKRRLCQGDILRDLSFSIEDLKYGSNQKKIHLNFAVVLSQECDIKWDFDARESGGNNDKFLPVILVCPAYLASPFCNGEHIRDWKMQNHDINVLKKNDKLKRYHYLHPDIDFSIPELVIDFKHFFTLPRELLYKYRSTSYVATISELFREELSQRFSNYLSRIGLPEI